MSPEKSDETSVELRTAPLAMSAKEFRTLGTALVDRIANFLDSLPQRPVTPA